MDRVWQEFYCSECDGYTRIKINTALNMGVHIVCAGCGHQHHRFIKDGMIFEKGRERNAATEDICPPKSAYSKQAMTTAMIEAEKRNRWNARRNGIKIENIHVEETKEKGLFDVGRTFLQNLWAEKHGG